MSLTNIKLEDNIDLLIKELKHFDYRLEYADRIWDLIFPNKKNKWYHVRVTNYNEAFYIAHMDGDLPTLEINAQKKVQVAPSVGISTYDNSSKRLAITWEDLIEYAIRWFKVVQKDWIKANKQAYTSYPLNRRYGIAPTSIIRACMPDMYRIDKELGLSKTKKFIDLVEKGYFRDNEKITRKNMTANDFFNYCKIAYLSSQGKDGDVDKNLTGREMYKRYADGRDEGLLEITGNSKQEFADWLDGQHPKKTIGGHPWEIKRGGNTTHIDLYVSRPSHYIKEGFAITVSGRSISRLKEAICMFLGIYDAGLPISIDDPEGICKRLLAQDNIGIIPFFDSLHRANQRFHEHENVYDVLHYDDLGRNKQRVRPFVTWEPLPILKPSRG